MSRTQSVGRADGTLRRDGIREMAICTPGLAGDRSTSPLCLGFGWTDLELTRSFGRDQTLG